MRSWMQVWANCVKEAPAKRQDRPVGDDIIPLGMHKDIAIIVAGIVLYGRQEEMR